MGALHIDMRLPGLPGDLCRHSHVTLRLVRGAGEAQV